jgi:hypothetical protein
LLLVFVLLGPFVSFILKLAPAGKTGSHGKLMQGASKKYPSIMEGSMILGLTSPNSGDVIIFNLCIIKIA